MLQRVTSIFTIPLHLRSCRIWKRHQSVWSTKLSRDAIKSSISVIHEISFRTSVYSRQIGCRGTSWILIVWRDLRNLKIPGKSYRTWRVRTVLKTMKDSHCDVSNSYRAITVCHNTFKTITSHKCQCVSKSCVQTDRVRHDVRKCLLSAPRGILSSAVVEHATRNRIYVLLRDRLICYLRRDTVRQSLSDSVITLVNALFYLI